MASKPPTTCIGEWVDLVKFKAAFKRAVKSAAGGKALTPAEAKLASLSAMKHMLKDDGYKDCQITFKGVAMKHPSKNKVPIETVCTQEFFIGFAKTTEKARKYAEGVIEKEDAEREKEAKRAESGGGKIDEITKRMTDTKLYTGAHKERFDETGKGRGSAGRKEDAKSSGYVGNYKGEGTFKGDK